MENIITYLIIFAAGWWIGGKVTMIMQMWTFSKILQDLGITEQQLREVQARASRELDPEDAAEESTSDLPVVEIKVEKHNDTLYVFRKDTDEFLGQGSDVESLIKRLGEKLRGVRLSISQEDGADFIGGHYNFNLRDKSISKIT